MGAWSTTILGSDNAYDILADLDAVMGLDNLWFDHPHLVKPALEAVPETQWLAFLAQHHDPDRAAQVLAYAHVTKGAVLPASLAERGIAGCRAEDPEAEGWNDPAERQGHLDALANAIAHYDGTPVVLPEEGLFEVILRKKG